MYTGTIKKTELDNAITRAKSNSDQWQAKLLEILLIPVISDIWHYLNPNMTYKIVRCKGRPYRGFDRKINLAYSATQRWDEVYGWILISDGLDWNSVRATSYSHSAAVCWDGIRRNTYCLFVEQLMASIAFKRSFSNDRVRVDWDGDNVEITVSND